MKITMYELLGMIKDGKVPKKIKYDNQIWEYSEKVENYFVDKTYSYEFLAIDILTKEIFISSGVDEINGDKEIIKLYDLIKADLVEKVEE